MQCTYSRKIEAPSSFRYCRVNAISTTYCECMLVAFGIHATRVRHIAVCGLPGRKIFSRIIS
jgi:hypothetical protein